MPISGVNLTPRPTAVYASDPALPRRPQDSLPSCLLGFERTRLALASSYQLSYRTPHRAPAGSQAWSMFGAWAAHTVSTRGPMPQGTCLIRLRAPGTHRHRPCALVLQAGASYPTCGRGVDSPIIALASKPEMEISAPLPHALLI